MPRNFPVAKRWDHWVFTESLIEFTCIVTEKTHPNPGCVSSTLKPDRPLHIKSISLNWWILGFQHTLLLRKEINWDFKTSSTENPNIPPQPAELKNGPNQRICPESHSDKSLYLRVLFQNLASATNSDFFPYHFILRSFNEDSLRKPTQRNL